MKFESRKHHETFYFIGYCEVSAILIAWYQERKFLVPAWNPLNYL